MGRYWTSVWALSLLASVCDEARAQDGPTQLPPIYVSGNGTNPDGSSTASGGFDVPKPTFGPIGNVPEKDLPFASSSIPHEILEDQIARQGGPTLANDPSIQSFHSTNTDFQSYTIRGFRNAAINIDGLPLRLQDNGGFYDTERVDILKGATSVLYGFAAPNGFVNYISKKPLDAPLTQLDLAYGTLANGAIHADVNRRFGDGDAFGVRVNAVLENGLTAIRPQYINHNLQQISADYRPFSNMRFWASYEHDTFVQHGLQLDVTLDPTARSLPPPPTVNRLFTPTYLHQSEESNTVLGGFSWTPDQWQFDAAAGYTHFRYYQDSLQGFLGPIDSSGSFTPVPFITEFNKDNSAYRFAATRSSRLGIFSNDFTIINTGSHLYTGQGYTTIGSPLGEDNIFAPVNFNDPNIRQTYPQSGLTNSYQESVDLLDRFHIGDKLTLWGGAIYSYQRQQFIALSADNTSTRQSQGKVTPLAAITYNPVANVTAYFNYIEALQQGAQAPIGAVNQNAILPPFVGEQYEVGIKSEVRPGLVVNVDLFSVKQANAFLDPADNVFKAAGNQLDRGVEFTVRGKVGRDLKVFGGFMFMDARVHSAVTDVLQNNLQPFGVANVRGNLLAEYRLPFLSSLSLIAAGYYTGPGSISTSVFPVRLPAYTTFDFGAKHEMVSNGIPIITRLYIENIGGLNYWELTPNPHLGYPRAARLQVTARF